MRALGRMRIRLFKVIEAAIFVLVLFILALVFVQVFTRYVLHVPVNWLEEAARMALVWLVMLGAAVAAERREHYVIDFIVRKLPARPAAGVLIATNVIALAFLATLVVTGSAYVQSNMSRFYVSLNVPRGYIYLAIPVGAVLMALSVLSQSFERWTRPDAVETSGPLVSGVVAGE